MKPKRFILKKKINKKKNRTIQRKKKSERKV